MSVKFISVSLLLSSLVITSSCFSRDDSKQYSSEQIKGLKLSPELSCLISSSEQIKYYFSEPRVMVDLAEKAFNIAVKFDEKIAELKHKSKPDLLLSLLKTQSALFNDTINLLDYVKIEIKLLSLGYQRLVNSLYPISHYRQGLALYNLTSLPSNKLNFLENRENLTKAQGLVSLSIDRFKAAQDEVNKKRADELFALILGLAGINLIREEEDEKDHLRSLDLFIQGIEKLNLSYQQMHDLETKTELFGTLGLAIKKALIIYADIRDVGQTPIQEEKLKVVAQLLRLVEIVQNSQTDQTIVIENLGRKVTKRHTLSRNSPLVNPNSSQILELQDFKMMIVATYCGLLKKAAIDTQKTGYLSAATLLFIKYLYNNEYKENPELKEKFISVNLEYLAGDHFGLTAFYRELREARIAQIIKQEQALLKTQEISAPSSQPKKATVAPSRMAQLDYGFDAISSSSSSSPYNPPELPKNKKKTRGEAWPVAAVATSSAEVSSQKSQTTVMIVLNKANYNVFEGIIGLSLYRNFKLADVKQLLIALGCRVERDKGKGVHQKITAPNGQIWVAPKDWDGGISDYYRLQLAKFIQDVMGIDHDFVTLEAR